MRKAPETFARKPDAERHLVLVESQLLKREWVDPRRSEIKLGDYAARWIVQRPALRPRTVQLYEWLLGRHITPHLGGVLVGRITTAMVRDWRTKLLNNGVSESMVAKGIPAASGGADDRRTGRRDHSQEPVPHPRR